MAEEPLFPDHGELLQGNSYEAVHFPAPVSTGGAFLISLWNPAFGVTVVLTVRHRNLGSQAVLAASGSFLRSQLLI